jgi:tRNA 2-selenouridine synthase
MRNGITRIERVEDYREFEDIIDVRTPAEFADDHIPGAINCPVLDDAQRVEVGTLYKQVSPFAAKRIGAAYVAQNVARHLREQFSERPKHWRPLIVCWRGGERSGAMTYIFRRVGWDAQQLEGGYKRYRQQVIERLASAPQALAFKVIGGATGSGKSRILHALARRGEQVLDLEDLACHKGSVLGVLPDCAQPSQKAFETRLLGALLAFDPARPVYAEAESRRIGSVQLPDALLERLRGADFITIEATLAARVDFLLADYDYFLRSPDWFNSRLDVLCKLQSRETIARWQAYANAGQWRTLVVELLELHYDPLYRRSQKRNFAGFTAKVDASDAPDVPDASETSNVHATDTLDAAAIDALAARIAVS